MFKTGLTQKWEFANGMQDMDSLYILEIIEHNRLSESNKCSMSIILNGPSNNRILIFQYNLWKTWGKML